MKTLLLLTLCAVLAGCAAVNERVQDRLDFFKTRAERDADDRAYCQGLGAQPGTDIFVQCMVGRAQIRATNAAAANAAANAQSARRDAAARDINPGAYGR